MTTKLVGKERKQALALQTILRKKADELARLRDEIRGIIEEYQSIVDSADEAHGALEHAADTLSQYV